MSYIVVDVESDGEIPHRNSMVCFGAVIVEPSLKETFYGRTKPISSTWNPEALAISGFSREEHETFEDPKETMQKFALWIDRYSKGKHVFGKHVCEKPLAMMEHIIKASTRPGAVVLDCFSGSAATGHACVNLGRDFIGIELCERWAATGRRRLELAVSGVKSKRIGAMVPDATEAKRQLGLFA